MHVRIRSRARITLGALYLEPGDEGVADHLTAQALGGQVEILGPVDEAETRSADAIAGAVNRMQKGAHRR